MKPSPYPYRWISTLAFGVFVLLILLQMHWLYKASLLQQQETQQMLRRLVSEIALEVNRMDHPIFHGEIERIDELPIHIVERTVDSMLLIHNIQPSVSFSIYQDSSLGIFLTNAPGQEKELRASEIKACLSCIVSFSVVEGSERGEDENEQEYWERMIETSTFRYYSPVSSLKRPSGETLWFSMYQPDSISQALMSLSYLFGINVILLLLLLLLFRTVLRSLSKHKELSKVKDDFFSHMTHEFKTPLSSIRLAARVLQQSEDAAKNSTYHQLIEKESIRLENQIDQLLLLALLDEQGMQLEKQTVDVHHLIREVSTRMRVLLEEKQAHLKLVLEHPDGSLLGDKDHLLNSLCNLVDNSLKYGQMGVQIHIMTSQNEKGFMIRIRDNGPGIDQHYRSHIFERFSRGQASNQYKGKGFGIGLSYVKTIIEGHGGTIDLNPTYTEGSEFMIVLP